MKMALCISGFLRYFDQTIISLRDHLLKVNPEIHIFIHTWKNCDTNNKIELEHISNIYNPKKIILEDQFNLPVSQIMIDKNPEKLRNINNVLSMFYKIYKCNELKCEYERENNFQYDCVIRFRSDIDLKSNIILNNYDLKSLNIPKFGDYAGLNDQFAFSNSENMNIYCDLYNKIEKYLNIENTYLCMKPELFMKFHTEINNLQLDRPIINYNIIRGGGNILNNEQKEKEWGYI